MISVAIDGPAGAGKSTIAKAASARLGFIYVDTGALYRAVGLFALRQGVAELNEQTVPPLLDGLEVSLGFAGGVQRVFLNGEDVSEAIRQNQVSMAASRVSAIPAVRAFLFDLQRKIAEENNIIMDGRDIGTVVLPHAQVKIFLTASAEERARRRFLELREKGQEVSYDALLDEIKERDHNDSTRAIAPLRRAEDAVLIDTSTASLPEAIELVLRTIAETLHKKGIPLL